MFIAYPITCDPEYNDAPNDALSDEIILPLDYFHRLIEEFTNENVLYVTLLNTHNNKRYFATLGAPHQQSENMIFVPAWILDLLQYNTIDETGCLTIEKATNEVPVATNIIIKPLDPLAFDNDLIDCFEKALINLHAIQEHITIPIKLDNDIIIFAYIEKVEPEPLSRIVSGEVNVEFLHDFAGVLSDCIPEPIIEPELTPEERRRLVRESWATKRI